MRYYYRVRRILTSRYKVCGNGACGYVNPWNLERCERCRRRLFARTKRKTKKDRSVDARLRRESELLDEWLTKLALVSTKIRYYRSRCKSLERERQAQLEGRVKPKAKPKPRERGIRIREDPT